MALTQQVQRVTLAGKATAVTLPYPSGKFIVKNFSGGDIYVSFESTVAPASSIRIASGYGQLCEINERGGAAGQEKTKTIYINGTGEVEVQQLWF